MMVGLSGLMIAGVAINFNVKWKRIVADSKPSDRQWAESVVAAVQNPSAIAEVELSPDRKSVAFLIVKIPVASREETVVVLGKSVNVSVADKTSFTAKLDPKQIAILDAADIRLADNIVKQLGAVAVR